MPKVCIFENVMGLLHKKNKKYVDKIINQLNDIGYSVGVEQLCECPVCWFSFKPPTDHVLSQRSIPVAFLDFSPLDVFVFFKFTFCTISQG
jgi:hypothetical protein